MAKRVAQVVAESLSMDIAEMVEYRYKRYTNPAVYAIGESYYTSHPTKPAHEDIGEWQKHRDQFGARGTHQIVWVCHFNDI